MIHTIHIYSDPSPWTIQTRILKNRVKWVLDILSDYPVDVNIAFISDEQMMFYNNQYRQKHKSTDVLSFPPSPDFPMMREPGARNQFLGDIFLSLDYHLQQKQRGETMSLCVERSIIHGLLHLKGFDHERGPVHYNIMLNLQNHIHRELIHCKGLPDWLSRRTS